VNRSSRHHSVRVNGCVRRYNPLVHFVYMVRCADGTLYTGYAKDPERRAQAHNAGRGAKYTSGRRPVSLVYIERFRSLGKALSREHALKRATRRQKEFLIARRERQHLHSRRPFDQHDGSRCGSFGN
jgi:putative endonuclease